MSDWETTALEDLSIRITKGTTPSKSMGGFSDFGVNYVKSESITHSGIIDASKFQYISIENHEKLKRSQLAQDDILFSMAGVHLGKTAMVKEEHLPANTNQAVCLIRIDPCRSHPKFVFYSLRRAEVKHFALNATSQSAQPNINLKDIGSISVPLPAIEDQKAIAQILGTLDDKIELNQKMNQTLEEIAKAIFKSWFVDFDPVRAKAEGRPTGLPPEISDLFPDELVDSEIGEIPKGWSVGAIVDFASLNKKTINPSQSTEIYEHFSIPAFDNGQSPVLDLGTDIKSNKTLVPEGSLLVSKLNPNTPRVWLPNPKDLHEQICSTEFMVYTATDHSNIAFLWGLFTSSLVAGRMEAMVTGTSKSHQRVKPNDVSGIMTVTPDARLVKTYGDTVLPMLNRTLVGKSESTVLSELRDTLLPKLISGELRIPDAEKFLEEAGI